ncbi:hypothetical protein Patl1_25967 [Pistacia atlantica]|uniref:Uncharacterized protein n=1 Tax=Pistacia atlantica TaxID=434234 RepID=A0ACC1B0T6_9ROSI|nr:hypothetical protein Patl1_25967 [Pistacia atlantica]
MCAACGHISCFWCVFNAMNVWHESHCPVCRHPYNHFPSICQLLHFVLSKLYPLTFKRREREVGEEENKRGHFSPQFDCYLFGSNPSKGFENVGNTLHSPSHQQESHCSGEGKSSSVMNLLETTVECGNDTCKPATSSERSEATPNATIQECNLVGNNIENKSLNQISVDDLSCAACEKMLFQPVVLNCGHVYCESCIVIPEGGNFRCPVCQSLQPRGLPNVCLILKHFLEEQFPALYAERGKALLKQTNCSRQQHSSRTSPFPKNAYSSWWSGSGPKVHVGVGCDLCGMSPIIGERYKCKDCKESIGFDLCENCHNNPVKIPGRFNQQHKPEHKLELVQPAGISDLLYRMNSELSDDEGSDAPENQDSVSHALISSADVPHHQEDDNNDLEDASSPYIVSVDVSMHEEDYSYNNPQSDLT